MYWLAPNASSLRTGRCPLLIPINAVNTLLIILYLDLPYYNHKSQLKFSIIKYTLVYLCPDLNGVKPLYHLAIPLCYNYADLGGDENEFK